MKTIDHRLEQASTEIRRMAGEIADRDPQLLRRSSRRRRTAGASSIVLLVLAVLALPVWWAMEPKGLTHVASGDQVTFEEYEAAYSDYVGCLRDAGYDIHGPLLFGRDTDAPLGLGVGENPTIQLSWWRQVGEGDEEAFNLAEYECRKARIGSIEDEWIEQEADKLLGAREWIDNVLACAAASDVDVPDSLSFDEMLNGVGGEPSDNQILDLATTLILDHGCRPWEE